MNVIKDTAIENAFHFTSDDLTANREGQLSRTQIGYLRGRAISLSAVVLAILAACGLLAYVSSDQDPSELPVFLLALVIPAAIVLAGTVGATELAVMPGVVSKRTGVLHLRYGIGTYNPPLDYGQEQAIRRWMMGRMGAYTMMVQDQEIRLSREQWELIHPGAYAAVYIVPTIRKIVAIEIIDHDVTLPDELPMVEKTQKALPPLPESYDDQDVIRA
jgi:hypothetical protein